MTMYDETKGLGAKISLLFIAQCIGEGIS